MTRLLHVALLVWLCAGFVMPPSAQAAMLSLSRFIPLDREAEQNKSAIIIPKARAVNSSGLSRAAASHGSRFMRLNRDRVTVSNALTARRAAVRQHDITAHKPSQRNALADYLVPSGPINSEAGRQILQLFDDRAIPTTNPFHR